ncbi:MAG: hypothetical protein JSV97_00465, partial [candidate division WOR-3 bacterium]
NLEYYRQEFVDLTGNDTRNIPVVIEDVGTMSNGLANPVFYNIHIFTYPPGFGSSLEGIESWYRLVSVHEYVHIAHLTKTTGFSKILTGLFGSLFQPNMYSPGWLTEGITVFGESQISPYEGRLNDGFFDSYIGTRVYEKKFPTIIEATNMALVFPFGGIYLYGGEFSHFLSERYGKERFSRFFHVYGSYFWSPLSAIFPFTGLDVAAKRVYGESFPVLFSEWRLFEENRFSHWRPTGTRVTQKGWYLYSLTSHDGKLYYVRSEPLRLDGFSYKNLIRIIELDPSFGKERIIASLTSSITTPLRISDNTLYYTTFEFKRGMANVSYTGFGATSVLHKRDLTTGTDEILFTDDIRSFCVLPDGKVLYARDKVHEFGSQVWLYANENHELLWETDYLIGELQAHARGVVVVARHDFENWNIYYMESFDDSQLVPLVETPWIEGSINLYDDCILFTANYDRVYSIYMYDMKQGKMYSLTQHGYADFGTIINDTLYFIGLSKDGFDIYETIAGPEEYHMRHSEPMPRPNLSTHTIQTQDGGYGEVLKTLFPVVRLPLVFPTDSTFEKWAYGLLFAGGDATNENMYAGYFAYDRQEDKPLFNLYWQSAFIPPVSASFFYDYDNSIDYAVSYPVFVRSHPGLSQLYLSLGGRSFEQFSRKEFIPGIGLRFNYPYTTIQASFSFPFERHAWGSTISRNSQEFNVGMKQILWDGELRLFVSGYSDRYNPDTPSVSIRGYDEVEAPRALVWRAEYSHHLVNLRKGLWNPNIYFEDLYATVFYDFSFVDPGDLYYSFGCEIKIETKIGFGFLNLLPTFGIVYTKDRKFKTFFNIYPRISL